MGKVIWAPSALEDVNSIAEYIARDSADRAALFVVTRQLIPQGIATPGLLANVMTAKYADALPLYRQEKIFERMGVELSRATMANWVIQVGQRCEPLMDLLKKEILSGPLVNMDETPVQVLNEPGRPNTSKSYMWVFRGGDVESPALGFS